MERERERGERDRERQTDRQRERQIERDGGREREMEEDEEEARHVLHTSKCKCVISLMISFHCENLIDKIIIPDFILFLLL